MGRLLITGFLPALATRPPAISRGKRIYQTTVPRAT